MKKLILIGLVGCGISYAKSMEESFVAPKKGRTSVAKLKEDIASAYGSIIKRQAQLCQIMAEINSTIVDQLDNLYNRCSANQACLKNHLTQIEQLEQQLVGFEGVIRTHHTQLKTIQLAPAQGKG